MVASPRSASREREVAAFDDGELWCDGEAEPASNPAGWYFRPRRGSQPCWIGPYNSADDAQSAPFSGDPLRDAQRRLIAWRRGDAPAPRIVLVAQPEPQILPHRGRETSEAGGGGSATTAACALEPPPPPSALPLPSFAGEELPPAAPAAQLALALPVVEVAAVVPRSRQPRSRQRTAIEQLPLGLDEPGTAA